MNLSQLSRLEAMVDSDRWDLSHEDKTAIFAAICGMPNPRLVQALEAVLLFHSASPWDDEKRQRWNNLTGHADATTRKLCDFIRSRLDDPFGEHVEGVVKHVTAARATP